MMRYFLTWCILGFAFSLSAQEPGTHRFNSQGNNQPAGWPNIPPALLALAEKPLELYFEDIPDGWQPNIEVFRVTATRSIPHNGGEIKLTNNGLCWIWTPPASRGPAHYEIRFEGKPARVVRIETRDPAWFKKTLKMLQDMEWEARGLSREERKALEKAGLRLKRSSVTTARQTASLTMHPRRGEAARRLVVWDKRDPNLIVWRQGPVADDVEIRAPRWWTSPAALATDQGLIRFLDLFSEPPNQP
ncbi:MAG: hypothetical protein ACI9E1_000626 [Cryomorphaceae bacterium]|jgi:hypothetical protein